MMPESDLVISLFCNSSPRACRETQDPTAPLWMQARAIAKTYGTTIGSTTYKTARGYYMSNDFWKFRELSAVYQLPAAVTDALRAGQGSSLVFAIRNLYTWTDFSGVDPEANRRWHHGAVRPASLRPRWRDPRGLGDRCPTDRGRGEAQ